MDAGTSQPSGGLHCREVVPRAVVYNQSHVK